MVAVPLPDEEDGSSLNWTDDGDTPTAPPSQCKPLRLQVRREPPNLKPDPLDWKPRQGNREEPARHEILDWLAGAQACALPARQKKPQPTVAARAGGSGFDKPSNEAATLICLAQDVYAVGYLAFIALLVRVKRLLSGGGYSRTTPPRIRAMLLIHPVARPFPTTSTSYQGCGPVLWSTLTTRESDPISLDTELA